MKQDTHTYLLRLMLIVACGVLLVASVSAEERTRGVRQTQSINGVVLEYDAYELQLHNEAGDHNLTITTQTKVQGELCVAAEVHARYKTDDEGQMIATSIQVKPELVELSGVIEELLPDGLRVLTSLGEVIIRVDENTVILIDGAIAAFGDLMAGDAVKIDAVRGEGDELLALVVLTESSAVELQGRISAVSEDSLTLFCLEKATEVGLTEETIVRIYGHDATTADLVVGMCAKIYAARLEDGSLEALLVDVSKGFHVEQVNGIVATVSETELVVLARQGAVFTFAIVPRTMIVRRNEAIEASDIRPGDFVQVKAFADVTLGAVAVRIRVEDPGLHFRNVTGVIASVEGSLLTLTLDDGSSLEVLVDSRTIIRVDREKGSVADLAVGKRVEVHLWRNPDESATAVAIKIVILDDGPGELLFRGTVIAAEPGLLTIRTARVGELGFVVEDDTVVMKDGVVAQFSDVQPGGVVEVHATSDSDGILTALQIDIQTTQGSDENVVDGVVIKVSDDSIQLETEQGKVAFAVTESTVVLIDGAPATIADVLVGDEARVEFEDAKGKDVATKIAIHR